MSSSLVDVGLLKSDIRSTSDLAGAASYTLFLVIIVLNLVLLLLQVKELFC